MCRWADRTPWHFATLLLEARADVDATDGTGATPLHAAVQHDALGVISLLLNANADTGARRGDGSTPIDIAKRARSVPSLRLLPGGVEYIEEQSKLETQAFTQLDVTSCKLQVASCKL